jgi:hypothetical protein
MPFQRPRATMPGKPSPVSASRLTVRAALHVA